jgi:hypothetical protein
MFILALVFVSVVGGIIGHYFRGRFLAGFLLSFVLGIFGWILIFLFSDHRRKCPFCRGVIDKAATRCRYCQSDLRVENQPKPEAAGL